MSVWVYVDVYGITKFKLLTEGHDTMLDVKQLVEQATGIDHQTMRIQHGKSGNMKTLSDDFEIYHYAYHNALLGTVHVNYELTSPTVEALKIANQILAWQNETKYLDGEKMMQKGEMTITPQLVYLTCQGLWKSKDAPSSSEPKQNPDVPADHGGHRETLRVLNERIATLEAEIKEKKEAIKSVVHQVREVRVPIELRQPSGNLISTTATPSQKVSEFKRDDVSPVLGVPPDTIRLACDGVLMSDGKRLFSFNVKEGTILDCIKLSTQPVESSESEEEQVVGGQGYKLDNTADNAEGDEALARRMGFNMDDLYKGYITINVIFVDLRFEEEVSYEGFSLRFDPDKSSDTLGLDILEEYDDFKEYPKTVLDLDGCDFKRCLWFGDKPLLGKASMMSVKSLGIKDGSQVVMKLYKLDDLRFVKLWEDAMEEMEVKKPEGITIYLNGANETEYDGKFLVKCPDEIGILFKVVYAKTSQAKELFDIFVAHGFDMQDWQVKWNTGEGSSHLEGHDTLSSYVSNEVIMYLVPRLRGGGIPVHRLEKTKAKVEYSKKSLSICASKVSADVKTVPIVQKIEQVVQGFVVSLDSVGAQQTLLKYMTDLVKISPQKASEIVKYLETSGAGSPEVKMRYIAGKFFNCEGINEKIDELKMADESLKYALLVGFQRMICENKSKKEYTISSFGEALDTVIKTNDDAML
eukprot:s1924_g4.t1